MAGAGKYKAFKGLMWLAVLLSFAGWVIMLGGVASLQENCTSTATAVTPGQPILLATKARSTGTIFAWGDCAHFYQWQWWTTSFAIVLFFIHLAAMLGKFMVSTRLMLIALHAINFGYQTWQVNTFWYLEEAVKAAKFDQLHQRGAVYLAGCITSSVAALAFFVMLGSGRSASLDRIYHGVGHDASPAPSADAKDNKGATVVEHNVVENV